MRRILENKWNISSDSLVSKTKKLTQRNLLRISSFIFDFAASVTIRLRILKQHKWRKKLNWDNQITKEDLPELFGLPKEVENLQPLHVHRKHFAESTSEVTLHISSDASYAAPASVAHLVYTTGSDSKSKLTFALGKAREAPLERCKITKLEHQAALFDSHFARCFKQH